MIMCSRLLLLFLWVTAPSCLSSLKAQSTPPLPPPPSNFDSTAKRPADLPPDLEIPRNMHIEVTAARKKPFIYKTPPNPDSLDFFLDPDLENAVIDRNSQDAHLTFHWQENRTSEAFIIGGFTFRMVDLRYPQQIIISTLPLNFWLNRQTQDTGKPYDFPGVSMYAPTNFAGTASLNGNSVLIFAPGGKPKDGTYPEANTLALDSATRLPLYLDDGVRVFTFTCVPDPNIQIDPQSSYLQKIKQQLGHYP